ncbi:hypothetical protein KUTeg_014762 [Tegillarca granosa]|uniref:C-type lectin domain-containing protein n=1 Tax=Tegillarca granosa TaxID=220873 RepID=A0ABQ9ETL2_TEGGR|nr:hypothetical protein KUTeg_014762 [Tegillarca granosa]
MKKDIGFGHTIKYQLLRRSGVLIWKPWEKESPANRDLLKELIKCKQWQRGVVVLLFATMCFIIPITYNQGTCLNQNACQDGWVPFNGRCYFISTTKASWHTSVTNCYNKGSRLADVKSMDELNFLKSYAKVRKDHIWLDGNDIKEEGKWIWSYNNEPFSLTDWYSGEPNGKRSENCLMILGSNRHKWKWNDAPCKSPNYFVCKKEMRTPLEKQCISAKDLLDELIQCKQRCNKNTMWFIFGDS